MLDNRYNPKRLKHGIAEPMNRSRQSETAIQRATLALADIEIRLFDDA